MPRRSSRTSPRRGGHRRLGRCSGRVFQVISDGQQQVADLKITDYLVGPLASDSDLQNILIVAGKRENASHNLYAALAKVSEDEDTTGCSSSANEVTHHASDHCDGSSRTGRQRP